MNNDNDTDERPGRHGVDLMARVQARIDRLDLPETERANFKSFAEGEPLLASWIGVNALSSIGQALFARVAAAEAAELRDDGRRRRHVELQRLVGFVDSDETWQQALAILPPPVLATLGFTVEGDLGIGRKLVDALADGGPCAVDWRVLAA